MSECFKTHNLSGKVLGRGENTPQLENSPGCKLLIHNTL